MIEVQHTRVEWHPEIVFNWREIIIIPVCKEVEEKVPKKLLFTSE